LPPEVRLAVGLAVALAVVYSATPLAIRLADRLQFYDRPIGYKGHGRPTPYLGGAAVMAGFLLALLAVSTDARGRTLPLLGGMFVLWFVGTVDDRRTVRPSARVAVEVLLAWMLWATGLGWDLGAGAGVDLALTVLWVLAVVNAFNLFDNMDGAASTMALVVSAGVTVMGLVQNDTWLAITAAALCGACLGFLPHNLASPARIFLGDGGSMPIGFGVAALVMVGSAEAVPAWQALIVGLLLVGVPALDTCLVMVSRRRRGISILTGGRDHLTHRTQRRLRTARAVAMALGAGQALVSALALFAVNGGVAAVVLVVVLYLVVAATAIALLEAAEREQAVVAIAPGTAVAAPPTRTGPREVPAIVLVVVLGAAVAASPFFGGYYDEGKWLPIGLLLLFVSTAAAIARPPRLTRPAVLALASLVALGGWALLSSAWAPSIVQATTEGNRFFVLAAILATGLVLVRTDVLAAWLVGGLMAGIAAVAAYVLFRLFFGDPATLFLLGRLNQPLGYVNAEGTVFIMGFWMCFALVERRAPWLAGLGAGGATLMACLALLTQSRGAALAMSVSVIVVIAAVPGSRLRRVFGLLACAAGVAAVSGPLLAIYDVGFGHAVPAATTHRAGVAILVAAIAVGGVWGAAILGVERMTETQPRSVARLARAGVAVLAALGLLVFGVALASAGRISDDVSTQWTAFTSNGERGATPRQRAETTRLVSGAGTRYDYWRIALNVFGDHPVRGIGAGNYDKPYFRARRTSEDIRQPHSLELQELAELGIVGGALLACLVAGLALGAARMRETAAASPLGAGLMVAGVGAVTAWLVHTSVDWIHLMPGVTGIALVMAAVLVLNRRPAPAISHAPVRSGRLAARPVALASAGLAGLALVVGAASLSRQGLADFFRDRADAALAAHPAVAIREADRSLRLDAENPRTYYVKAAALARFDQAEAARQTLLRALSKEPDDFVTWTLLGDLAVRRGRAHFDEARRNYARASALNPVDRSLRDLARNPLRALSDENP
jgi:UDP-N-acetylmuramyl pentapeptide phosphotransferase/UDP-N-acetylglucosamine-1-phosphate transferase